MGERCAIDARLTIPTLERRVFRPLVSRCGVGYDLLVIGEEPGPTPEAARTVDWVRDRLEPTAMWLENRTFSQWSYDAAGLKRLRDFAEATQITYAGLLLL